MITQQQLEAILIADAGEMLKPNYRNLWTKDNPTYGYCYIVSEALYHYEKELDKYHPMVISFDNLYNENSLLERPSDAVGTHWFLAYRKNIVDYTKYQFSFPVEYYYARKARFFDGCIETKKGLISNRGYEMAKRMGLINV